MAEPRMVQEIYKMSLELLVMPKSKKLLKKIKKPTSMGGMSMGHRSNKINKVVLDRNPKYKTNTHESILI